MKQYKKVLKDGFISGLFGSLCCVTPLVLVLLGLSTVSGGAALAGVLQQRFRLVLFIPLAIIFLSLSIYFHIKRKEGVCNFHTLKNYKSYVLVTIIFAIIVWVLLIYVIVPVIFGLLL